MDSNIIWQASPGKGKHNKLTAISIGENSVRLELYVEKMERLWKGSIDVPITMEQAIASGVGLPDIWNQTLIPCANQRTFAAIRFMCLAGTPFLLKWDVRHHDVHGDASEFEVNDSLCIISLSCCIPEGMQSERRSSISSLLKSLQTSCV